MTDTSVLLLLNEIVIGAIFFIIQILVNIHLADIVEQIEIKILHLAFFKLLLKNLFHFPEIGKIIPRNFVADKTCLSDISSGHYP